MQREEGCFKIWTDGNGRKIIYSQGEGIAKAHEVEWLYTNICDLAKEWNGQEWAYVAFIEKMGQVSEKGSTRYIKLHETLALNHCKCIAYIEGNSYEVSVQAAKHKQASNTPTTTNRYFNTVDEGLAWLTENGF